MLQWGRGRLTADDRAMNRRRESQCELQWGRGRLTADDGSKHQEAPTAPPLQWGRGRLTADDAVAGVTWNCTFLASMGPRSADRG